MIKWLAVLIQAVEFRIFCLWYFEKTPPSLHNYIGCGIILSHIVKSFWHTIVDENVPWFTFTHEISTWISTPNYTSTRTCLNYTSLKRPTLDCLENFHQQSHHSWMSLIDSLLEINMPRFPSLCPWVQLILCSIFKRLYGFTPWKKQHVHILQQVEQACTSKDIQTFKLPTSQDKHERATEEMNGGDGRLEI